MVVFPAAWRVMRCEVSVSRIALRVDRGLGARIAADGVRNFGDDVVAARDLRCAEKSPHRHPARVCSGKVY